MFVCLVHDEKKLLRRNSTSVLKKSIESNTYYEKSYNALKRKALPLLWAAWLLMFRCIEPPHKALNLRYPSQCKYGHGHSLLK